MNRKQLVLLLVALLVLGAGGLTLYKKQSASWNRGTSIGQKLLADLPVNDIAQVTIRRGTNQLNLVRKDDAWHVRERHEYPADFPQIREFLLKARDLKAVRSEPAGPSQLPRLHLAAADQGSNAPTVVEFKGPNDKVIRALLLGKMHMKKSDQPSPFGEGGEEGWPDGRYVKVGFDSDTVAIISDPMESIEPTPQKWLSKEFVKVEKPRSIEVLFSETTNSWKLARETENAEWKLADLKPDEQLDSMRLTGVTSPLSAPWFTDVSPGDNVSQSGTNPPTVLKVETFDGFAYAFRIGTKTNEDIPVVVAVSGQVPRERTPAKDEKPEDKAKLDKEFKDRQKQLEDKLKQEQSCGKWTYLLAAGGIDTVLKNRAELLIEKRVELQTEGNAATNSITVQPTIENPPLPAGEPKP